MSVPRPVDESMSLLHELMHRPVDPAYAAAAARRVARGLPRSTSTRTALLFAAAVLLGFLLAVSALNVRATTATVGQARALLVETIETRQASGDRLAAEADALQRQVNAARGAALTGAGAPAVLEELTALQRVTGAVAVTGPGVQVTLDDAAASTGSNADPRAQTGFAPGRVSARDLQVLTNGLWQAGAEAVAVNGQRLTARSAIRFAGEALLVDYRPLTRPYVLQAVGDPQALRSRFLASSTGTYFTALTENDQIPTELTTRESMTLPASADTALRYANPASAPPVTAPSAAPAPGAPEGTR